MDDAEFNLDPTFIRNQTYSSQELVVSTLPRTSKKREKPTVAFMASPLQENHQSHDLKNNGRSFVSMTPQSQRSFIRTTCNRAKRVRFFRNGDLYFKGSYFIIVSIFFIKN